ncbi:serine hydrolase FSH [Aspergillus pseudonomiae]|nr:serine hydrolase FSH [Aspergillus pseudonomiae]
MSSQSATTTTTRASSQQQPTPAPRPTILCFHGAGTNGLIFRLQARGLVRSLAPHFHFEFLDAPFEAACPGPGVGPVFQDLAPFRRWHCDGSAVDQFDLAGAEVVRERRVVRRLVRDALSPPPPQREEQEKGQEGQRLGYTPKSESGPGVAVAAGGGRGRVVGVLGFSQGTRVATGVCLDAELGASVQFAVLIAGTCPALMLTDYVDAGGDDGGDGCPADCSADSPVSPSPSPPSASSSTSELTEEVESPKDCIAIPSVHVQGLRDPWLADSKRLLRTCYKAERAVVVEFAGAHQVPTALGDVKRVAAAVLEVWKGVGSREE